MNNYPETGVPFDEPLNYGEFRESADKKKKVNSETKMVLETFIEKVNSEVERSKSTAYVLGLATSKELLTLALSEHGLEL